MYGEGPQIQASPVCATLDETHEYAPKAPSSIVFSNRSQLHSRANAKCSRMICSQVAPQARAVVSPDGLRGKQMICVMLFGRLVEGNRGLQQPSIGAHAVVLLYPQPDSRTKEVRKARFESQSFIAVRYVCKIGF
jgi:hypothetical protein